MKRSRKAIAHIRTLHHWLLPPETEVGWTPYLWLIYFGFFWLQYAFQPPGNQELALALLSSALFLALFFSGFRRSGRAALVHVLALAALGVAWAPFNVGASTFFVYAGAFAMLVGPPRQAWAVLIGLMVVIGLLALLVQPMPVFWLPGLLATFIVGAANIYFAERERQNAALRLSQSEVQQLARVAERERIAHDLHDVLGHRLSVMVLKSELAGKLFERDPQRARAEIADVERSAREALSEVREAIAGYRERSLSAELEQARLALTSADVALDLRLDEALSLDAHTEAVLTLVIREAVTNIVRHARARRCWIHLTRAAPGAELTLEIGDDGGGRIRPEGGGVDGMRARIEALGGLFRLDPDRRLIRAHLPVASEP
ncbi:MAG: sensor histidine kinase [Wenzhouxiangella sp.]|nr:MAG: sensor histidine kinase [Wenzhouxiangella sp.]